MPNCFSLTRKSNLEAGPVVLQKVDEEMCAYFGQEVHPKYWYCGWYDAIGFSLAMGKNWQQIRVDLSIYVAEDILKKKWDLMFWDRRRIEITNWLEENFTYDAWAEIGKR